MFTEADRIRAIELYFKYGRKITAVIREVGYPTERNLRRWVRAWEASGGDISCLPRKERYSDAQKHAAVDHYLLRTAAAWPIPAERWDTPAAHSLSAG